MKKILVCLLPLICLILTGCDDSVLLKTDNKKFQNHLINNYGFSCNDSKTYCFYKDEDVINNNGVYRNVTIQHEFDFGSNYLRVVFWHLALNNNTSYEYKESYETIYYYDKGVTEVVHVLNNNEYVYNDRTQQLKVNRRETYDCRTASQADISSECKDLISKRQNSRGILNGYLDDYTVEDIITK